MFPGNIYYRNSIDFSQWDTSNEYARRMLDTNWAYASQNIQNDSCALRKKNTSASSNSAWRKPSWCFEHTEHSDQNGQQTDQGNNGHTCHFVNLVTLWPIYRNYRPVSLKECFVIISILFVCFDALPPSRQFFSHVGTIPIFLGWTSTKQWIKCLAFKVTTQWLPQRWVSN